MGGTDPDPGRVIDEITDYTRLTNDHLVMYGTTSPQFALRIVASEWTIATDGDHLVSAATFAALLGATDGEGNTFTSGGRTCVLRSENGYAVAVPV